MSNIFVQGDRDARGIEEQVKELGQIVARDRDTTLWLGSAGKIVEILSESGARCVIHHIRGKENVGQTGPNVSLVGCETWGTRMDRFLKADGFVFFPGRVGTMAHIVPILAHIIKKLEKEEPKMGILAAMKAAKRVALLNWSTDGSADLARLMRLRPIDVQNWMRNCASAYGAYDFLTAGPK